MRMGITANIDEVIDTSGIRLIGVVPQSMDIYMSCCSGEALGKRTRAAKAFERILPDTPEFTVKSVASHAKIDIDLARKMLYCLCAAGVTKCLRSEKREKIYTRFNKNHSETI
jgi:hypothetical protein